MRYSRHLIRAAGLGGLLLAFSFCAGAEERPPAWTITREMLVTRSGEPASPDAALLLQALSSRHGEGLPVSQKEFLALLKRPQGRTVYAERLIRYATPLSDSLTKVEHEAFARVLLQEPYQKSALKFMRKYRRYLQQAQARFGVLPQDIVALLTWESGLGRHTGRYRIFNVFLGQVLFLDSARTYAVAELRGKGEAVLIDDTLTLQKENRRLERRKTDAMSNLVTLLRMAKAKKVDPLSVRGSWGGAIGYVQFLPYNLKYAVDADSNGINLFSWPDAIFSVAKYLKERGRYNALNERRRLALLRYNASQEYADGILMLADTLAQRLSRPVKTAQRAGH